MVYSYLKIDKNDIFNWNKRYTFSHTKLSSSDIFLKQGYENWKFIICSDPFFQMMECDIYLILL